MFSKKLWLFLSLMLVLAGCGGGSSPAPKSASSPAQESTGGASPATQSQPGSAPADAPSFDASPSASPPAPPPSKSEARAEKKSADTSTPSGGAAREERPSTRPGLGTEYGEARTSRVHDVTFVRGSGNPFATAMMNYNDKRGVDALVASQGSRISSRGLDTAAGAVTVSIRDASGNPLEAVKAGDRTFVVGAAGQRYSIVLQNHTSHRFEAVATVDGLDVINGKSGTFDNRGYVLMPFATLEIDGFRQSTSTVAAFRFAAVQDSYAAQMGKARNVGVIGVAFFSERGDAFVPENEVRTRNSASPFPADPRFAQPPPGR